MTPTNRLADWPLPRIGLGTGTWNHDTTIPQAHWDELVACVLAQPNPFFDTAALYGAGLSETRLGAALKGVPRDSYRVASKAGWDTAGGTNRNNFSRDWTLLSVEASLKRLGLDYLDIVHVHDPDCCQQQALDEAFPALYELRDQGVIRAVGSGMNQWQMLAALRPPRRRGLLSAGRALHPAGASRPALLALCQERGIARLSGRGLQQRHPGHRAGAGRPLQLRARAAGDRGARAADGGGVRAARRAAARGGLQFSLAHPAVRTLVVGANTPAEFQAALAGLERADSGRAVGRAAGGRSGRRTRRRCRGRHSRVVPPDPRIP